MATRYNYPGSEKNSTSDVLGAGETFTGEAEAISITEDSQSVTVAVLADQSSADDGLQLQFSADGVNWDLVYKFTVVAGVIFPIEKDVTLRYFRVVYTTVQPQGAFWLQTKFNTRPRTTASSDPADAMPVRIVTGTKFDDGATLLAKADSIMMLLECVLLELRVNNEQLLVITDEEISRDDIPQEPDTI